MDFMPEAVGTSPCFLSIFIKTRSAKMDLQTTKLTVLQKIMGVAKPALLDKINELLDDEMIVGYTVNGDPLTMESYNSG